MPAGIYIHIPFCERKCPYCDFYSVAARGELKARYLAALEREALAFPTLRADTLYLGGGTPSLLEADDVARLVSLARERFSLDSGAEITLECNPATASAAKLRAFREAGVNRLSVGVQSADDGVLKAAGRLHTASEALQTLADARAAGFGNVSADLMIGLPGETGAQLEKSVAAVSGSGAAHVSAYILKIMPDTPYARRRPQNLPDEDETASLYERCCDALEARGFKQYEISNFALAPEYESRHNKKYWACGDWVGLGAAAHSCLGGERRSFVRDIERFISAFESVNEPSPELWRSMLDFEGALDGGDYIMLRLRTSEGLSLSKLNELYKITLNKRQVEFVEALVSEGFARFDGDSLALTRRGMLVSNSIIEKLI